MQEREEWVGKRGRREEKGEEGRRKKLGRGEGRAGREQTAEGAREDEEKEKIQIL